MIERSDGAQSGLLSLDSAEAGRGLELQREICELLGAVDLRGGALDAALLEMEGPHGDGVYSELLHVLCHLRFDPEEAKGLWASVVKHRGAMQKRLGSPLDLRVALLSYLVEVRHELENPKIIERTDFERTRESAYTDHLTGLRNYRYFAEQLNHEVLRSDQYSDPLSLVMLDVDHFKSFNDRNGHEAGNEVLRRIGEILRGTLRKVDVGARYGGEEFAVILPSTPKRGAQAAAERLRAAIEAENIPLPEAKPLGRLTVSLGIATYPADGRSASEFVEHCDRALYSAKAEGRNRVGLLDGMRSYPRIQVQLDGRCRVEGVDRPLKTIQVGTGGMSFWTTTCLDPGELVDVELVMPGRETVLAISGRVLRVNPGDDGGAETAISFLNVAPANRRLLASFVRNGSKN